MGKTKVQCASAVVFETGFLKYVESRIAIKVTNVMVLALFTYI